MDRVCLLTGAAGRLGATFCRLFRNKYQIVAVWRRNPPDGPAQNQRLIDPLHPRSALPENDRPLFSIRADLGTDGELERIVDLVNARFGRVDLLVHSAAHSVWAPIVDGNVLFDNLEQQFRINTFVPLRLTTLVARTFWRNNDRENGEWNRNVVNVSSISATNFFPGSGQSVYSATKAALNRLTFHLADELRPFQVRVNAVAPNSFPSHLPTEDVANAIVRLDEGGLTGRVLVLDRDGERLLGPAGTPRQPSVRAMAMSGPAD